MSNVARFHRRCAWSKPCDEHATERRQMLWYCWDHADIVDANREAMFAPIVETVGIYPPMDVSTTSFPTVSASSAVEQW